MLPDPVLFHYHLSMKSDNDKPFILIAGSPCSGKSSTGKLLSIELNLPFYDLDDRIEDNAELSIPEIFRVFGENEFRKFEKEALDSLLLSKERAVIALGGGCLLNNINLARAIKKGIIVTLSASESVLLKRRRLDRAKRPLAMTDAAFLELLDRRRIHYSSLPNPIDTTSITPEETVILILETLPEIRSSIISRGAEL